MKLVSFNPTIAKRPAHQRAFPEWYCIYLEEKMSDGKRQSTKQLLNALLNRCVQLPPAGKDLLTW